MHEFVLSGGPMKRSLQIKTLDLAKRLLDFGFHPPTVYFPLLVEEALMVEPTETETKETLDAFADAVAAILREARRGPRDRPQRALHDAGAAAGRGRRPRSTRSSARRSDAARRAPRRAVACLTVRIFSGIQPTGRKHLGNYIGAIAQYVSSQERGEGHLLHRRPARDHRRLRPGRAARAPVRHDRASCSPPASTRSAASSSARATCAEHTELTWLLCSA